MTPTLHSCVNEPPMSKYFVLSDESTNLILSGVNLDSDNTVPDVS